MAATVRTWTGAVSRVWALATNWSPSDNYPVTGDTAILDDTDHAILGGDQSANVLVALYITHRFRGTLGASGSPAIIAAGLFNIKGKSDAIWIEPLGGITTVVSVSSNAPNAVVLGGPLTSLGYTFVGGGRVTIPSGTVLGSYTQVGSDGLSTVNPWLTISSGVSTVADHIFVCNNGLMELNQAVVATSKILVSGGKFVYGGGNLSYEVLAINGGVFEWRSGNLGTVYVSGNALLDGRQTTTARTVSSLFVSDNATADLRTGTSAITVSAFREIANGIILRDEV